MTRKTELSLRPPQMTEVFMLLHAHHLRPKSMEYEYMTGQLREDLLAKKFGPVLSKGSARNLARIGKQLKYKNLTRVITDPFVVTAESATILCKELDLPIKGALRFDGRVCESDLGFLSRDDFIRLCNAERRGDANATVREWMKRQPDDFNSLCAAHVSLWNETLRELSGQRFLFVLHVEGLLLYSNLALGLPRESIGRLQIPRCCVVHVTLSPQLDPLVAFHDVAGWNQKSSTLFSSYG